MDQDSHKNIYRANAVLSQMTYRADDTQSKRRDLWAIEKMVNRANGTRASGHRANGNRADVVAPGLTAYSAPVQIYITDSNPS